MTSQADFFDLYEVGQPPLIHVYCHGRFRAEASAIFRAHRPATIASFANMNILITRFACGEQLSTDAFRQEGQGWAFRAARLRFYGCFSRRHGGCFVLSHPLYKSQQRLAAADAARMVACRDAFDRLPILPPQGQQRHELH